MTMMFQKPNPGRLDERLIYQGRYVEILNHGKNLNSKNLITGFPGSGLFFIYEVMRATLASIGWNYPKIHGMVSWQGIAPGFVNTDKVIHIVRQPLRTISRAVTHLDESEINFMMYYTGHEKTGNRLYDVMRCYVAWDDFCFKRTQKTFMIENIYDQIYEIYERAGLPSDNYAIDGNKNNIKPISKVYDKVTWNDLLSVSPPLYDAIVAKTKRYGYLK